MANFHKKSKKLLSSSKSKAQDGNLHSNKKAKERPLLKTQKKSKVLKMKTESR